MCMPVQSDCVQGCLHAPRAAASFPLAAAVARLHEEAPAHLDRIFHPIQWSVRVVEGLAGLPRWPGRGLGLVFPAHVGKNAGLVHAFECRRADQRLPSRAFLSTEFSRCVSWPQAERRHLSIKGQSSESDQDPAGAGWHLALQGRQRRQRAAPGHSSLPPAAICALLLAHPAGSTPQPLSRMTSSV